MGEILLFCWAGILLFAGRELCFFKWGRDWYWELVRGVSGGATGGGAGQRGGFAGRVFCDSLHPAINLLSRLRGFMDSCIAIFYTAKKLRI